MKYLISSLALAVFITTQAFAYETVTVDHNGEKQTIRYDLYVPPSSSFSDRAVLICIGGLPIIDGEYVHSDPTECRTPEWEAFAIEQNVAILGVGFLFKEEQWKKRESYQFAQAWSARALDKILKDVSKKSGLDQNRLFLYGISAGAQFAIRYAFVNPNSVKAVAAHAAGGYDKPVRKIKTRFLITVGSEDNKDVSRVDRAGLFVNTARETGINVRGVLIPNLGHRQTMLQDKMSRSFFAQALSGSD